MTVQICKRSVLLVFSVIIMGAASIPSFAASAVEIDAKADATLNKFYKEVVAAKELSQKAKGILVFPSVLKAGFGVGGEYGEGALRIGGKTVDYYSTAAASFGFQYDYVVEGSVKDFSHFHAVAGEQALPGMKDRYPLFCCNFSESRILMMDCRRTPSRLNRFPRSCVS